MDKNGSIPHHLSETTGGRQVSLGVRFRTASARLGANAAEVIHSGRYHADEVNAEYDPADHNYTYQPPAGRHLP